MASRRTILGGLALPGVALSRPALAQGFPTKPIRILIPNPPGGLSDLLGRGLGNHLTERWGQPVIADNRSGATGTIAADTVAKAAPDGYTILIGNIGPNAVAQTLMPNLPYDARRDFTPITRMIGLSNVLVLHPSVPATDLAGLLALMRARPGAMSYGSSGPGGSPHLSGAWFAHMMGVNITHVPYRGAAPSMTDLLAGNINMIFENIPNALPHIQAGSLRPIAVTSAGRSALLPEVPSFQEAGLTGYSVSTWFGIFGPAGLPTPIVARYHEEITAYLARPEVSAGLRQRGAEISGMGPMEFTAFVQEEIRKWARVIQEAGISQ